MSLKWVCWICFKSLTSSGCDDLVVNLSIYALLAKEKKNVKKNISTNIAIFQEGNKFFNIFHQRIFVGEKLVSYHKSQVWLMIFVFYTHFVY